MSYQVPESLKYTKEHEWVKLEGNVAIVGITEFAQSELGDIVFIDLPKKGTAVAQGKTLCVVESTKAASDVYAPISGSVEEANDALSSSPELVNSSPYEKGWLAKLSQPNASEISSLMSASEYKAFLGDKIG